MEQCDREIMRESLWVEYVPAIMKGPNSHMFRKLHDKIAIEDVIKGSKKLIMKPSQLQKTCGKFDYDEFLDESLMHLLQVSPSSPSPGNEPEHKQFVVVGKTQSGKSSVKGIVQSMCGLLKIPLIVITKGVKESIDLHTKLEGLAGGTLMKKCHIKVASCDQDNVDTERKEYSIYRALEGYHGGTLIIADTEPQVQKAIRAIKRYRQNSLSGKFILVVDEADAMTRTEDREQVFEQALQELMEQKPSITMKISATIFPVMLDILQSPMYSSSASSLKFFELEADDEYVGLEDLKPLTRDGKEVFLEHGEINSDAFVGDIPYANEKVMALYNDAMSDTNREGILLMDCSCPFVNVPEINVKKKAEAVQEYYRRADKNKYLTVVTFTGDGTSFKPPNQPWDESKKKSNIGDIIKYIDKLYYLQMPIFIFGYSKICRGISFRSDERVPTHMLVSLGMGHNCSTVIQTLGRATFNGKSVLQKNGFDHVKCLTTEDDYKLSVNHSKYIKGVVERVKKGDSLAEAVNGANKQFPDIADFLSKIPRKIGKMPSQGRQFQARLGIKNNIKKHPESLVGYKKIAKKFDGKIHFGKVVLYDSDNQLWHILYDDDDHEDMDCEEVMKAIKYFKRVSTNLKSDKNINGKRARHLSSSSPVWTLLDIDDIPEIHKDEAKSMRSKRGTVLEQKERNRRIYYTKNDDTPTDIANKFNLDVRQIMFNNNRREHLEHMKEKSKLNELTAIVLPIDQNNHQNEMEI